MISDPRCTAIARRLATPLRVAVSGRRGVGRRTVAQALTQAGITLTRASADVDVYVLADAVKPEDRAAIGAARRPMLVVLNKADLIAAARARCAQLSARAGTSIEPLVGILAVDGLDDAVWAGLQRRAGGHPVDLEPLLDTLDEFGVAQATAAIRRGATRADVETLLRGLSGIDDIVGKIEALGAPARYQRVLDAVAELETLAVADLRIREFLTRDDTVVARMMDAIDVVEAVGMDVDRGDTAAAHLGRAVHWQRYRRGPVAASHRACGADIVRGSLRLWTKVGGAV